jgi:hypothetical protein
MTEDEKKERDERRIANAMAFIAKHPPRTRAQIATESEAQKAAERKREERFGTLLGDAAAAAEEERKRQEFFEEWIRKNPPPTFEEVQKRRAERNAKPKPVWVLVVPVSDEFAEKVRASPAEAVRVSVRGDDGVTTMYRPKPNSLRAKLGVVQVREVDEEGRPVWEKEKAS